MILKLTAEKRNSRRFSLSMETLPKAQTFIVQIIEISIFFSCFNFLLSIAAGVYRLSHTQKTLFLGAKHDLGSRPGTHGIRNGNCVRKSSRSSILEHAELQEGDAEVKQLVPVQQVSDSPGQQARVIFSVS